MINFKIYAIVVTFNGSKWIDKCFGSLVKSSLPLKVIAIDNGSTDKTPYIIRERFPQVEVIENGQNQGFGKANNIGLKKVVDDNADYAFLLNQDAWVENDTIEKLVEAKRYYPIYGIISPIEYYRPGVLDVKFEKYYAPKELLLNINRRDKTIYETEFVNAAAWLISKEAINTVGGFDSIFPHYGEDVDFCRRLIINNFKIGIASQSSYYHDRPQLLTEDRQIETQIQNRHIKRILYFRWGQESTIKKLAFSIKEYLIEISNLKGSLKKDSAKNLNTFLSNIARIKKIKKHPLL